MGERLGEVDVGAADFRVPQCGKVLEAPLPRNAGGKVLEAPLRETTDWVPVAR